MTKSRRIRIAMYVFIGLVLCVIGYTRYRAYLNDRLFEAVNSNDAAKLLNLLQWGADPDACVPTPGKERSYALTRAIERYNSGPLVQVLLEHGANPNPHNPSQGSPLYQALLQSDTDVVQLLLEHGARKPESDTPPLLNLACYRLLRQYGYPPTLGNAVYVGDLPTVQALLDQGANINQSNERGQFPLLLALLGGHDPIGKLLVAHGANVNQVGAWNTMSSGSTPLILALQSDHDDMAKVLIEHGASVRPTRSISSLLDLYLSSKKPKPEIVALLKAKGARHALPLIIKARDIPTVRTMIREGVDVNQRQLDNAPESAPLFCAIRIKSPEVVQLLLDAGANVNIKLSSGQTPLMKAAQWGDPDVVRALIAKGANLNAVDETLKTATKYAILQNRPDLYRIFRDAGAKITLFDAAAVGDIETIRKLAQQGENVNKPNRDGATPLKLAAAHSQIATLQALRDLGAK